MTGCKIGKIKMKNGGAPVYLASSRTFVKNSTVKRLEEALGMARDGHIVSVGICAVTHDNQIMAAYNDDVGPDAYAMIGASEYLKKKVMDTLK